MPRATGLYLCNLDSDSVDAANTTQSPADADAKNLTSERSLKPRLSPILNRYKTKLSVLQRASYSEHESTASSFLNLLGRYPFPKPTIQLTISTTLSLSSHEQRPIPPPRPRQPFLQTRQIHQPRCIFSIPTATTQKHWQCDTRSRRTGLAPSLQHPHDTVS